MLGYSVTSLSFPNFILSRVVVKLSHHSANLPRQWEQKQPITVISCFVVLLS